MSARIVVTGTDTGIGKTVFAAALAGALDATYWKPVQSGLEDETDSGAVQRLSGLAADRILPERYRLQTPASPHLAAEIDGVDIDVAALELPSVSRPLVVEGAGGLMVPLTRETTYIDVHVELGRLFGFAGKPQARNDLRHFAHPPAQRICIVPRTIEGAAGRQPRSDSKKQ